MSALKAHVDSHLAGALRGTPDREWLASKGWAVCTGCGVTASAGRNAGVHSGCAARARIGGMGGWPGEAGRDEEEQRWARKLDELPTIADVFTVPDVTKEYSNKGLKGPLRQEYIRLVAQAVQYNLPGAWDHLESGGAIRETAAMKRSRACWIEVSMFAKAVLRGHKRGLRPAHAYAISKSRLDRWVAGERRELWEEVGMGGRQGSGGGESEKQKAEAVGRLAALGRAGKEIQRIISPGLAKNTTKVEAKLRSKFPRCRRPRNPRGPVPPPAMMVDAERLVEVIRSLSDSAAGPSGLRPQFLKEVIGDDIEDPIVGVMVAFAQLFVDGLVPRYLRQWYGGGTLVGIGKDDKPLDEDARPIVCGEAWRRVACKVAFLDGKKELAEELKPHQVAVGMPGGGGNVLARIAPAGA